MSFEQRRKTKDKRRVIPGVSVVATVLNERAACARLMIHLEGQSVLPEEYVLVDGGSTDGTREYLHSLAETNRRIRVIDAPGCNIAEGRNIGIREACGDILACTDSGSCPESDWLKNITAVFEDPDVQIAGGNYQIAPETRFEEVSGLLTMPGALRPVDPERFNPSGRSIAFRRSAWQMAGGYPEWLYTAEDTLFDLKCRRMGCVFAYVDDATVRWRPRTGWRSFGKQFLNYARGEARIGRGENDCLFWISRYAIGALSALAGAALSLCGGGWFVAVLGMILALVVTSYPHFGDVRRVARRTGRVSDWFPGVALSHWIVLNRVRGYIQGERDRVREPGRYVGNLIHYYRSDRVASSNPPWRMVNPPMPRTLVVSWHWPPSNRASSNVIGALFSAAPRSAFKVLTREMNTPEPENAVPCPALDTETVPWPSGVDGPPTNRSWLSSIVTVVRMVFAARRIHEEWTAQRVMLIYPHRFGLLAGRLIARMLGVPFAAWMHDLHIETLVTKSRVKRRFWEWLDESVVRDAMFLAVPSREMAEHYSRRGCESIFVLPHCRPAGLGSVSVHIPDKTMRMVYSGNIYEAHEDSIFFLCRILRNHPDVELEFMSPPHPALGAFERQWLPRREALWELESADAALVVLGFNTPYPEEVRVAFPSKLVDAICLAKPVLVVAPPDSFLVRFVRETGCGVAVDRLSLEAVRKAVSQLHDPDGYASMAENARRVAAQLDPDVWMERLIESLRGSVPSWSDGWESEIKRIPLPGDDSSSIEKMAGVS